MSGKLQSEALPVAPAETQETGAVPQPPSPGSVEGSDMAFVKLDFAVLESHRLTHCDKLVYCAVLSFSGWSKIDPSESQIAERCNVSRRQVQVSLRNLQWAGVLTRKGRVFTFGDLAAIAGFSAATAPPSGAATAQKSAATPRKAQPLRRNSAATKHSIEIPSIDSSIDKSAPKNGAVDGRHYEVAKMFQKAWLEKNSGIPTAPWSGRQANQLAQILKANPGWTTAIFGRCIANWMDSEVNHAEWPITSITKFANKPLNQYNRPKPKTQSERMREQHERLSKEFALEEADFNGQDSGDGSGLPTRVH